MWIHLTAVLALALPVLSPPPAPTPAVEDPDEVEAAVSNLETAHKSKEASERIAALREFGHVSDARVCEAVAKFLKDGDATVVVAGFEALRHNEHEAAVTALEKYYKSNKKKVLDNTALQGPFMKALGWHGSSSSVAILVDKPFSKGTSLEAVRARIFGLGKIGTPEALDGLVGMTQKVGRRQLEYYIGDVRISLYLLTGTDQGNSPDMWRNWWNQAKKGFQVPAEPPKLSASQQAVWNEFWGIEPEPKRDGEG